MADRVTIPPDLRSRFSEIGEIEDLTNGIKGNIDKINNAHKDAAGRDDEIAKAYHEKSVGPMQDLSKLVDNIGLLFGAKARNGVTASNVLDGAGEQAAEVAGSL